MLPTPSEAEKYYKQLNAKGEAEKYYKQLDAKDDDIQILVRYYMTEKNSWYLNKAIHTSMRKEGYWSMSDITL